MKLRLTILAAALAILVSSPLCGRAQDAEDSKSQQTLAPVTQAVFTPVDVMFAEQASYEAWGGGCSDKSSGCRCPQCRRRLPRTWGSVEFLHAWTNGRQIPALATTSPIGTAANVAGVLPTQILFGDDKIGSGRQSAGRLDFGIWLDPYDNRGLGVRMYGLEGDSSQFVQSSGGTPILGVPFINADLGNAEDAVLVAYPGLHRGSINHFTSNDLMMGEAYYRLMLNRGCGFRLDGFVGYHVIRMDDGISISSSTEVIGAPNPGNLPVGTTIDLFDSFKARNEFHGGEVGLMGELTEGCWSVKAMGKVSVGNLREEISISGQTAVNGTVTPNIGLFAQNSNRGTYVNNDTEFIPEATISIGYELSDCIRLTAGYHAMYIQSVALAGDQIDRTVSLTQVTQRPTFQLRETEFWVQGITIGLEWDF